jgi:GH25 family lysozyme M1 (1,4-beta-N-acetylmuramidase)
MVNARGEDRSSFQAVGPWHGNDFGICKATEGLTYKDPVFAANWANLRAEGLPRAAYHFFHPALSASAQAAHFAATVKAQGVEAGDVLMIDAELTVGEDGVELPRPGALRRMHMPLQVLPQAGDRARADTVSVGSGVLAFLQAVGKAFPGHRQILYTDLSMAQNDLASCMHYALFIAYYAASPPKSVRPWPSWLMWQREAGGGYGGGDLDWYNGDAAAVRAWFRDSPTPVPDDNWTETIVSELPTITGGTDSKGANMVRHKAQGLMVAVGKANNIPQLADLAIDGNWGATSKAACQRMEKFYGLTVDAGYFGKNCWTKALLG